jgi:VanZ family protein
MVIGVVAGSLVPAKVVTMVFGTFNDKLEHAGAYAALMAWYGGMFRRVSQIWVGTALVALGGVLELLQSLTPTRTPDVLDFAADSIGVLVGLLLSMTVLSRWCQRIEKLFPVR